MKTSALAEKKARENISRQSSASQDDIPIMASCGGSKKNLGIPPHRKFITGFKRWSCATDVLMEKCKMQISLESIFNSFVGSSLKSQQHQDQNKTDSDASSASLTSSNDNNSASSLSVSAVGVSINPLVAPLVNCCMSVDDFSNCYTELKFSKPESVIKHLFKMHCQPHPR